MDARSGLQHALLSYLLSSFFLSYSCCAISPATTTGAVWGVSCMA